MDKGGEGFLVVCGDNGRVVGVVADGDVRRGLIADISVDAPITKLMNRDFKFGRQSATRAESIAFLKTLKCRQLPIVDQQGRLIDILFSDHLDVPNRDNLVVIMAGGLGTRLRPMTETVPKPMLRVGNKPFLERILENLIAQGFRNCYFCVHYLADQIIDYFGDGSKWGVKIEYVREEQRLGTAGGLAMIGNFGPLPILVLNADLVTRLDFGALLAHHAANAHVATMAVRTMEFQVPFGVVETEGSRLVRIREKPLQSFLVNAGIYVVNSDCLRHIPRGEPFDMPMLLDSLVQAKESVGYFPLYEAWMDVGRVEDYEQALQVYANPDAEG